MWFPGPSLKAYHTFALPSSKIQRSSERDTLSNSTYEPELSTLFPPYSHARPTFALPFVSLTGAAPILQSCNTVRS